MVSCAGLAGGLDIGNIPDLLLPLASGGLPSPCPCCDSWVSFSCSFLLSSLPRSPCCSLHAQLSLLSLLPLPPTTPTPPSALVRHGLRAPRPPACPRFPAPWTGLIRPPWARRRRIRASLAPSPPDPAAVGSVSTRSKRPSASLRAAGT